ncbi:hypothetical protein BOX15_Mlig007250g1 [Macrostomum lignano]|uniref:Uncharacterized protein n=1 Tax=Macrostomum lignano TaxID=282301 RepID=A0A267F3I9_9PLAT|nr:hypothetical protein BOX15_Mlig007250g1 [Macrostomum lignano]
MKCSKRCAETPGGASNMADLLSSVNTLIDNLSDSRQQPRSAAKQPVEPTGTATSAASSAAAAAAAEIDKQLERLDRLFAKSKERRRRRQRNRKQPEQKQQQKESQKRDACGGGGGGGEGCSRSPCSNCTTSNCNALNVLSISDSSEESPKIGRCCAVNAATKCAPATKQVKVEARQTQIEQQQQEQPQKRQQVQQPAATSRSNRQAGMAGISDTLSLVSQNASNRRQYIVRRGRKPPPEHTKKKHRLQQGGGSWRAASPDGPNTGGNVDFNYLKDGLGGGHGGSGISGNEPPEGRENCANTVVQVERMVKSLQLLTDRLKRQYEQRQRRKRVDQQRRGFGGCSWENSMPAARMKAEIRQAQARATCLRNCLRAALGSGGACGPRGPAGCASGDGPATAAVGCRHRGVATEQARDPITDIKCKYERCLLYSRYDVNWPFLHIIAPTPPIFVDPICCEND